MASQKPILIAINSGGIAKLSDDTFWRIAPLQLSKAKGWTMGIEVMIQPTGNPRWTHKLRDVETGAALSVVPSQSPPYDLVIRRRSMRSDIVGTSDKAGRLSNLLWTRSQANRKRIGTAAVRSKD